MEPTNQVGLLLAGPRGRRFCLLTTGVDLFAIQLTHRASDPGARKARARIEWVTDLPVTPAVVADVAATITRTYGALNETLTAEELFACLADTADAALYWQPPDEEDQVAATPEVRNALEAVARAVIDSPATTWWTRPLQTNDQHYVGWIDNPRGDRASPPPLQDAAHRLSDWRRTTVRPNSVWWSYPPTVSTSASHGDLPATQLQLVEDTLGWRRARVARLQPAPNCRILELVTPQDWVDLVDAHPLDVTRSRNQLWPEVTGEQGPWLLPDWSTVAADYDAVHLTVFAYLSTAGRALPCRGGNTVLAGWEPDVTYWLTDTLTQAEEPSTWAQSPILKNTDEDTTWRIV